MTNNPANIMTIQELLKGKHEGFDRSSKKIKMIRLKSDHKEIMIGGKLQKMGLRDIYKYHREDLFEEYFKEETNDVFKGVDYVVVFFAEDGTDSRLVGVYENQGADSLKSQELGLYYYNLVALKEFEFLNDRVVVDWGGGHGPERLDYWWKNNIKYVIRIDGYSGKNVPIFDSYENIMLNYSQLYAVIYGGDATWKSNLKSVNCIYCIVDKSNEGKLYIGSTFGIDGIYGRWKEYADKTSQWYGVELKKRIEDNPDYVNSLQWIVLEVLPLNVTQGRAIAREDLYKEKFCTREFGYNKN